MVCGDWGRFSDVLFSLALTAALSAPVFADDANTQADPSDFTYLYQERLEPLRFIMDKQQDKQQDEQQGSATASLFNDIRSGTNLLSLDDSSESLK